MCWLTDAVSEKNHKQNTKLMMPLQVISWRGFLRLCRLGIMAHVRYYYFVDKVMIA